jgi:hypothetical protein
VPAALLRRGWSAVSYYSVYPDDDEVPDPVWISMAGGRGLVVLTKDQFIEVRLRELVAVADSGSRVFVFPGSVVTAAHALALLDGVRARLLQFLDRHMTGPYIARLCFETRKGGRLEPVARLRKSSRQIDQRIARLLYQTGLSRRAVSAETDRSKTTGR